LKRTVCKSEGNDQLRHNTETNISPDTESNVNYHCTCKRNKQTHACDDSMVSILVITPEIALTTVDFPWATCPMVPAHSKEIFYLEYGHKPRMLQQQLFPSLLHASKIRLKVDKPDILSKSQRADPVPEAPTRVGSGEGNNRSKVLPPQKFCRETASNIQKSSKKKEILQPN
jgi:hypothetical protein